MLSSQANLFILFYLFFLFFFGAGVVSLGLLTAANLNILPKEHELASIFQLIFFCNSIMNKLNETKFCFIHDKSIKSYKTTKVVFGETCKIMKTLLAWTEYFKI